MSQLRRVRTCHVARYQLLIDTEAPKYTAFRIELLPHRPLIVGNPKMRDGGRWLDALEALHWLRRQKGYTLYSESVFVPYANIIAVDRDQQSRELLINNHHLIGELHPDHSQRVKALCHALDLLDGAPMTDGQVWN